MLVDKDGNLLYLKEYLNDEEAKEFAEWMKKGPIPSRGPRPPWMYPKDHPLYRPKKEEK